MFGIVFDGHPALTRILMPDDWDGHPQRKDYPLGGVPVEYHGATIPAAGHPEGLPMSTTYDPADPYAGSRETTEGRVYTVTGGDWDLRFADPHGEERLVVNMGPQHPSTHGVLRLVLDLEGETVTKARVGIGYLHTGIEKNTRVPHLDPGHDLRAPAWTTWRRCSTRPPTAWRSRSCSASRVPQRAATIRVLVMELNRIASHLVALATCGMELGALTAHDQRLPRAGDVPRPARGDHRPADEPRLRPPRRPGAGPARGRDRVRSASS